MARPVSAERTLLALRDVRLIPVVVIDDAGRAGALADALTEGGLPCAEFTLRTPEGLDALRRAARPGFLAGAGTVTSPEQVDAAADAGAAFIVSPGFDAEVVERAHEQGLAALPGVATATEVQGAARHGVDVVKLFPAQQLGGLAVIEALAAPFPSTRFVPSGGVTAANAADYLGHPAVWAASGSWMVRREWIADGDFDAVRAATAEATAALPPADGAR
jgi:2-dehydro-3-deoxyphosphogluconate aldolase/(4S)-4-hydroxy-2-oxoglutarate aldolase